MHVKGRGAGARQADVVLPSCTEVVGRSLLCMSVCVLGQSHPQQLISDYKPGEPLNMEVKVDVYPDVTFTGDYKGLKVRTNRERETRGKRRGKWGGTSLQTDSPWPLDVLGVI